MSYVPNCLKCNTNVHIFCDMSEINIYVFLSPGDHLPFYYVSYALALDCTHLYLQGGVSLRTYYRALNQKIKDKYKIEDNELLL